MAPKRAREEADRYPKLKALKTLEEQGILNGYVANNKWCRSEHYKNQGVPDRILEQTALHILHSSTADRQRYFDLLISGGTSIATVTTVIATYRRELAQLRQLNQKSASGLFATDQVLVIDSNGVVH